MQTRLTRLRKTDDSLVLGHLQAEMGHEAVRAGNREGAERPSAPRSPSTAASSPPTSAWPTSFAEDEPAQGGGHPRGRDPGRARARLPRLRPALALLRGGGRARRASSPSASASSARTRATGARGCNLARHLRAEGRHEEAHGLLLRALETNPQVMLRAPRDVAHAARARRAGRRPRWPTCDTAEGSVFYRDPHICTACRYRADDMLWRCPHCHEWNTFVEERLGPGPMGGR